MSKANPKAILQIAPQLLEDPSKFIKTATPQRTGLVAVGKNLAITDTGVLSVDGVMLPEDNLAGIDPTIARKTLDVLSTEEAKANITAEADKLVKYTDTVAKGLSQDIGQLSQNVVVEVNGKYGNNITLTREDLNIPSDEQLARQEKEDRFVITWSGLNQKQENQAFITTVNYLADLDTLPKFNGRKVTVLSYSSSVKSEPLLYVYDSSRASENNGGTVWNGWVAQLNGYLTPEMFGAKGGCPLSIKDNETLVDTFNDDTQSFKNMLSCGITSTIATYKPRPDKRYKLSKQLYLGSNSTWLTKLNILVTGSPVDTGASGGYLDTTGKFHEGIIIAEGVHVFENIDSYQNVVHDQSNKLAWVAIITNNYYVRRGLRPETPYSFVANNVVIRSNKLILGNQGAGAGAIRFGSQELFKVNSLYFDNVLNPFIFLDLDCVAILNGGGARACRSGGGFNRVAKVICGNYTLDNRTTKKEDWSVVVAEQAGNNTLVVAGCPDVTLGNIWGYDVGEHGFRCVSFDGTEMDKELVEYFGNFKREMVTNISAQHVKFFRVGASGWKNADGDASKMFKIGAISLASLYVEDCGTNLVVNGGLNTEMANHFGINVQGVRDFTCGSYTTKRVNNTYNGVNFIRARSVSNFYIGNMIADGSYNDGIFWNCGTKELPNNDNITIGNLSMSNIGENNSWRAFRLINPAYAGKVFITGYVENCASLFYVTDESKNPLSPWFINLAFSNVPNVEIGPLSSSDKYSIVLKNSDVARNSSTIDYSDMQYLLCNFASASTPVRNGLVDVFLSPSNSNSFVAARKGEEPSVPVGNKLSGVWRSKGVSGSAIIVEKSSS